MNQKQKENLDYYSGLIVVLIIICIFYYFLYNGIVSMGVMNLIIEMGTFITFIVMFFSAVGFILLIFILTELYEGIKRL